MSRVRDSVVVNGIVGQCGVRKVFLGFAPASALHQLSFSDVLDEESGKGYQRRFNERHSLDFRRYIQEPTASTIPLTFNLRPDAKDAWKLRQRKDGSATLIINHSKAQVLSQVDCQHRLGYLADLDVSLAFMTFIGLSVREEMQVFNVINGKAKGLSSSLLDYHETKLVADLGRERPELFIALRLNDDAHSPWYKKLDLGGEKTVGMKRRASLRMMQKAVKRFLKETNLLNTSDAEDAADIVLNFWVAIALVLEEEWNNPRKYMITKGIGIYSLMSIASELYIEAQRDGVKCTSTYFTGKLSDFVTALDWSNRGPLKGYGGQSGVQEAISLIRSLRERPNIKVV